MKCSSLVIEGLLKMPNALFILSTHLYEIGDALRVHPNIQFSFLKPVRKTVNCISVITSKKGSATTASVTLS